MAICNTHASDEVLVILTLEDNDTAALTKYSIINSLSIPKGGTLILEEDEIEYDMERFSLTIQLNESDSQVDVIIR